MLPTKQNWVPLVGTQQGTDMSYGLRNGVIGPGCRFTFAVQPAAQGCRSRRPICCRRTLRRAPASMKQSSDGLRPSRGLAFGSQTRTHLALPMSDWRRDGSSSGSGSNRILLSLTSYGLMDVPKRTEKAGAVSGIGGGPHRSPDIAADSGAPRAGGEDIEAAVS